MTVRVSQDGTIELLDDCSSEDAEVLQRYLLASPLAVVEWGGCAGMHAAVLQVMLVARPAYTGDPAEPFLREHVAPLLKILQ